MLISTFLEENGHYIWGPLAEPETTTDHMNESINKIKLFLKFEDNASKHLNEISGRDIMDFTRHMKRERGTSDNTLNHYRSAIGALYTAAVDYEVIGVDDRPNFKNSKIKLQTPRYYNAEEIEWITHYLSTFTSKSGVKAPWLVHLFTIAMCTGMRKSEIWKTTRDSIRMRKGRMYIAVINTKNGFDREVPLSDPAIAAFEAVNWQFPRTKAGNFADGHYRTAWEEIRRKLGPGDKMVKFHTTRHSAATTMANDMAVNLIVMAKILGHKDLSTTRRYVHEKHEVISDIADRLGEAHSVIHRKPVDVTVSANAGL